MIIDLLCHSPVSQDKNELHVFFLVLLGLNYYTFDNVGRQKYCYHEMNDAYLTLSPSIRGENFVNIQEVGANCSMHEKQWIFKRSFKSTSGFLSMAGIKMTFSHAKSNEGCATILS